MAYWFLELILGVLIVFQARSGLEFILNLLAPRRWREAILPAPPNADNHSFVALVSLIVSTSTIVFLATKLPGVLRQAYIGGIFAITAAIYMLTWALVFVKHWWILEPGAPLRQILDSLARSTNTAVGRVRLRAGKNIAPRVYLDGSIELTTGFMRFVSPEAQAFLLAAALYQRKTWQPVRRLIACCLILFVCPLIIHVLLSISLPPDSRAEVLRFLAVPLGLYFAFYLLYSPKYNWETLKFALIATGNLEIAERVIREMDSYETEKCLTRLRQWWEKRQSIVPAIQPIAAPKANSAVQQQTLGRKP